MVRRSVIVGCGSAIPDTCVTNDQIAARVDTSHEWILQRTGIHTRYLARDNQYTSDLSRDAANNALKNAKLSPQQIDLIVLATTTPDHTFPSTATKVQAELGITHGKAFDIQAVCSGFIFALAIADNFLRLGQAHRALVIGAETLSRIIDWDDRHTCILFGDGAGAVILEAIDDDNNDDDRGILSTHLHSDGRYYNALYVDGGPSTTKEAGIIRMTGQEIFKHAILKMSEASKEALQAHGLCADDIDWVVPHQANLRILTEMAHRLSIPKERIIITVDRHANTSAASIPLAIAAAVTDERIKRGNLVLMQAMGGGFTWGSALVRW